MNKKINVPSEITKLGCGIITKSNQLGDVRDSKKIEDSLILISYLAVVERINYFLLTKLGNIWQDIYRERNKLPKEIIKVFDEKFNKKESLKKKDIFQLLIEFNYITAEDEETYKIISDKRDSIGHDTLRLLINNENEITLNDLIVLIKFFKQFLIKIYNNYYLPTYKECLDNSIDCEDPIEIITGELICVDVMLSSLLKREKYSDLFEEIENK